MREKLDIKLLYVEDEVLIRLAVSSELKAHVRDLVVAGDGAEGLSLFREHRPDVVMTDIRMPEMNGLEMLEAIRKIDPSCRLMAATAFSESEYFLRLIKLGVDGYFLKPIDMGQCLGALRKCADSILAHRALTRFSEETRRDLEVAAAVQRRILPSERETARLAVRLLSHPLGYVSGDSFALSWSADGNRLRGCLFDAMGHGISAALEVSALHLLFGMAATRELTPVAALEAMNDELIPLLAGERFVAAIGFDADADERSIRISSAGVGPFLILSGGEGACVPTSGLPLGIKRGACREERTFRLSAGDGVVFMSDGLSERIPPAVAWPHTPEELWESVRALAASGTPNDDVSAVGVFFR